ncbi:MAG: LysM peptidoglycan-binding domain-containing protein [Burkholderiaceae bacterium]|nr:LysM peptidoglycan-binding domain-containing protein [Burkholderiaceae bacterium]
MGNGASKGNAAALKGNAAALKGNAAASRGNAAAAKGSGTTSSAAGESYTIERGDTLAAIAKAHGLDAKDLATWNRIDDPRRLQIGQKIRLSAPGG